MTARAKLIWATPNLESVVAYCARVSNPSNQSNDETAGKLLRYCMKHGHWSVFEMGNICIELETTRDIARQILRHRSFSFQEFCLSGDTDIYFAVPSKLKVGSYKPTYKMQIKELYRKWQKPSIQDRLKAMHIKVFDEESNRLTTAHIKEVFKTGTKPVFEITLSDGKKIKTTKEHKFLTKEGFDSLENIVGLSLKNGRALMSVNKPVVGINGIPWYQDKETLLNAKRESIFLGGGLEWLAETTETNYNTLRKWLKVHNISYTKDEVVKTYEPWNKNKTGYSLRPRTVEERKRQSEIAKARGVNHNWYRGGNSHKREPLNETDARLFREKYNYTCQKCGEVGGVLDIHHKIPVSVDPSLTHDQNNWELLCRTCHREHHREKDMPGWQQLGIKQKKENTHVVKWVTIEKIEFVGEEETYDIEVDHQSHNYVANGIVVHNSQRYAEVTDYSVGEARLQDNKNRQNSIPTEDRELTRWWTEQQVSVWIKARQAYEYALANGIAKEVARKVLPEGLTMSRMYVNGTLRSWLHYIEVRCDVATQKEHREVAEQCRTIIKQLAPSLFDEPMPDGSYYGTNTA